MHACAHIYRAKYAYMSTMNFSFLQILRSLARSISEKKRFYFEFSSWLQREMPESVENRVNTRTYGQTDLVTKLENADAA